MAEAWNVSLGSLWRTYKVQKQRTAPFVKHGTLSQTDDGRLELQAKYDPPGSGWMAAGAAIVTGILVIIGARALGVCAGPGWLLWFIGIALLRRRTLLLNLSEADGAVIDRANRRLAFRLNYEGKQRWVAFDVPEKFDESAQAVSTQLTGRVGDDKIDRALSSGSIVLIVMAILFVVLIAFSIIAVMVFMTRRPPQPMRTPATSLIQYAPLYAIALPVWFDLRRGLFRRRRCIEG